MAGMTAIAQAGDTLDALLWRTRGRETGIEAVLEANPALAERGVLLAEGQPVLLPTIEAAPAVLDVVQLWD